MARTTAARGANRARLVEAAYAVLAERGYEETTIKAVARAAGVAPALSITTSPAKKISWPRLLRTPPHAMVRRWADCARRSPQIRRLPRR